MSTPSEEEIKAMREAGTLQDYLVKNFGRKGKTAAPRDPWQETMHRAETCATPEELRDFIGHSFTMATYGALTLRTAVMAYLHGGSVPQPTVENPRLPTAQEMLANHGEDMTRVEQGLCNVLAMYEHLSMVYGGVFEAVDLERKAREAEQAPPTE